MPTYQTDNSYKYFVYPYKGITPIDVKDIKYLAEVVASKISNNIDAIFTVETDGIFTALPVAMILKKPLIVARSFNYKMRKSFHFTQKTGYYERELFFHFDPLKIKKIAIIDCILSTGGTVKAVLGLFAELAVEVEGVYVVVNKTNYSNVGLINSIKDKFFSLFDIEIRNKKISVKKSKYYR
jgi:adenine/guanine phosphoribosyltransferase-like PRPP-binding protein